MKKIALPIFILTFFVIIAGIIIFQTGNVGHNAENFISEYLFVGVVIILFLVGIFVSIRRMKREKQGLPEDDEMSRKILQKSAAQSFFLSLLLWLVIMYIQNQSNIFEIYLMGYGILGMVIIFVLSWLRINFKGVSD
ncbi:hypothetical protein ACFL46_05475 [Candidatus Neomarinimicrobiota bacterium]